MDTVRRWAASLVPGLGEDDEVVIVDGESADGSREFLRELAEIHGFAFYSAKMNRGRSRQLAFEKAGGQYIISLIDTDDIVVSLQEAKNLYHDVVEIDPKSGSQRAFLCPGFFIIPRWMLEEIGGWPDLQHYEDQLVAYRLAIRGRLTASWKVSPIRRGEDPKKKRILFRAKYSFQRIRDELRLGFLDARNLQAILLLPWAWITSWFATHYEFRRDWWNLDVHRDEFLLPWIRRNSLSQKLLMGEIESSAREVRAEERWRPTDV